MRSRDANKRQRHIWQPSVKPEKKDCPFPDWTSDVAPATAHPISNAAARRRKLIVTVPLIASATEATGIGPWTATDVKRIATASETAAESLGETTGVTEIVTETETETPGQKGDAAGLGAAAETARGAGTPGAIEIEGTATTKTCAVVDGTGALSPAETRGGRGVVIPCVTADAAEARVRRRALRRALLVSAISSGPPGANGNRPLLAAVLSPSPNVLDFKYAMAFIVLVPLYGPVPAAGGTEELQRLTVYP